MLFITLKFMYVFISIAALAVLGSIDITHNYNTFDSKEAIERLERSVSYRKTNSNIASFEDMLITSSSLIQLTSLNDVANQCKLIMYEYSNYSANFTKCLLQYSRPFRMCENCVEQYTRAVSVYNNILNNVNCSTPLLLADGIHIMSTIHDTFTNLWTSANCANCFDNVVENETTKKVTHNFTSDTALFLEIMNNVTTCCNMTLDLGPGINDDDKYNEGICTNCSTEYIKLNRHFKRMRTALQDQICMDILDMMNYTRLMWSTKFNCQRPTPDPTLVIVISVIVVIVTILLYLSSKFVAKIRLPSILREKRMSRGHRGTQYGSTNHEIHASMRYFAAVPSRTRSTSIDS